MNLKTTPLRFDPAIQQQVDRLLLEQNGYAPLDWLLAESRLFYEDYEAWRNGELPLLDAALFGDPERIQAQLSAAGDYAAALGLAPETQVFQPWRGEGPPLRFSADETLDRLLRTRYLRADHQAQMDLFMDNASSVLAAEVTGALLAGRPQAAAEALTKLTRADAGHPQLGAFERLLAARRELEAGPWEAEALLARLEDELAPLAQQHLDGGRDYLIPFWRRLTQALGARPFDSQRPRLHASYSAGQAAAWREVLDAVSAAPAWTRQPELLLRAGHAAMRLRREPEFLLHWFRLCWLDAPAAERLAGLAPGEWLRLWQAFLELDAEPPVSDFPAWLLIRKPALARGLSAVLPPGADPKPDPKPDPEPAPWPESFGLCLRLSRGGFSCDQDLLATRRRLRDQAPWLFEQYMQARQGD